MTTEQYRGTWEPESFAGKELIGIDFSHRCLVGADFSGSVCKDCDFSDSDLSHANFRGTDLYRCDFSRSVLYATEFDNANLTRANFKGSYTYGWLLNTAANVTYTQLLEFSVEERRRSVLVSSTRPDHVQEIAFGDRIESTADLCRRNYQVGHYRYVFSDLDRQEAALQRSQVYGRLKRLYRENQNGEAAIHCLYYERYYLTRSFYRYSPLTGGHYRDQLLKALSKTVLSYLGEITCGYGLRPLRIIRNLVVLFALFAMLTGSMALFSTKSGVLYTPPPQPTVETSATTGSVTEPPVRDLGEPTLALGGVLHYALLSMVTPDPQSFTAYGAMVPLSFANFALSAVLLALLFASVFLRLLND
jgi:hypothetical protein